MTVTADARTWRLEQFVFLGCTLAQAERLADSKHVDLREFQALVQKGCSAELAERILAPVEA